MRDVSRALLCAVLLLGSGGLVDGQSRRSEPKPWYWEAEQQLKKVMDADGLGRAIVIEEPRMPKSTNRRIERLSPLPRLEWAHGEMRGDYETPVRTTVVATWMPQGQFAGRLLIEGVFNDQPCRFDGRIASDRVTVTGDGVCADQRVSFRACIERSDFANPSNCTGK